MNAAETHVFGNVRCTRVPDLEAFRMPATRMFASVTPAELAAVERIFGPGFVDLASAEIIINFNAYVVDDGTTVMLVDPCIGDGKTRPQYARWHQRTSDFLARLAAYGYPPERIDVVVSTHLHADHVGWNTSWNGSAWVPTFPNAVYLFVEPELAYWSDLYASTGDAGVAYGSFVDSVRPIISAGVSRIVPAGSELLPGVRAVHAPGHTPGNVVIEVDGGAALTGDIFHHPLQILRPALSTNFCLNPVQSSATRERLVEKFAAAGTIVFPAHFATPSVGRVVRNGDGYGYAFVR
jgi:glyoxylase-like metal-dependent hydrolase (beta-lactamase superfamily II)